MPFTVTIGFQVLDFGQGSSVNLESVYSCIIDGKDGYCTILCSKRKLHGLSRKDGHTQYYIPNKKNQSTYEGSLRQKGKSILAAVILVHRHSNPK